MNAGDALRRMITANGPLSVADYMAFCLTDLRHGYYVTRDPFGTAGDFVTAPEISQMFGELIGLWAAQVWIDSAAPQPLRLAELGPGRGTLMADALRAISRVPALKNVRNEVHLVEMSPALRQRQHTALQDANAQVAWHDDVATLPDAPAIVIANEFFDALPVHQAVKAGSGWHERQVGLDADGQLAFGLAPHALTCFSLPAELGPAPLGAVYEWRDSRIVGDLAQRIVGHGGALLVIDYGHTRPGFGDTLQAVRRHVFADVLAEPGEADLTAHVDFAALTSAATRDGAVAFGPIGQGDFLMRLGIAQRAAALQAATPAQAIAIDAALHRLTGRAAGQMGELFKVLALAKPGALPLPGFDTNGRFGPTG